MDGIHSPKGSPGVAPGIAAAAAAAFMGIAALTATFPTPTAAAAAVAAAAAAAAVATATAAAAAAAAVATAAAAAATAVAAAAAAFTAGGTFFCFIDTQGTAIEFLTVKVTDDCLSVFFARHLGECETTGTTGFPVHNNTHTFTGAAAFF
jgi:hypothetical protein